MSNALNEFCRASHLHANARRTEWRHRFRRDNQFEEFMIDNYPEEYNDIVNPNNNRFKPVFG